MANSLPTDDAQRALYPMAEGCLDYFPNALAEVSRISYEGNQKHNPGQPMHWSRGKSTDHRNKVVRHTIDAVQEDEVGIEHAAQAAWRALAFLQEKIERVRGVPMSPASRPAAKLDDFLVGDRVRIVVGNNAVAGSSTAQHWALGQTAKITAVDEHSEHRFVLEHPTENLTRCYSAHELELVERSSG